MIPTQLKPGSEKSTHLVISLETEKFEDLGKTTEERVQAFKGIVRRTVHEIERKNSFPKLRWIAGIHLNTNAPHAHLAIHSRNAGFSMIELLIVVAILVVISAIAIPSLIASRRAGYENTAKQKLASIAQQQTAFKTLIGKRRYGTLAELRAATAGGSPLLTTADTTVTGWTFSDEGSPSATAFGAKVVPATGNPASYSFYISEDQTLRRCALAGPWTKVACTPTDQ